MPENLNDTAATKKQNRIYDEDRTHPQGKPYSRKQQESNAFNAGRVCLYKGDGSHVFASDEVEDALSDGWKDTPKVNHNNPDHCEEQDDEMNALWAEVDRLGVKPRPHGKTGKVKLMKAITDFAGSDSG